MNNSPGWLAVLLCLALLAYVPVQAQENETAPAEPTAQEVFSAGVLPVIQHFAGGIMLPCLVHTPRGFDSDGSYNLLIGLHGYGSNPEIFSSNWYAFDNPGFIYACPQAPYPAPQPQWMGYSWLMWEEGSAEIYNAAESMSMEYVLEIVEQMHQRYNIDEVYLLGFSQGSALAYYLGLAHPDLFAGIASIAGVFDPAWFGPELLADASQLRVFIAQGTQDNAFITTSGQTALSTLTAHNIPVTYLEFDDGHTIPADILKQLELWIANEIELGSLDAPDGAPSS